MTRQSLRDVITGSGHKPMSVKGFVDVVVRNEDGSVADHRHQRNIVLESFRPMLGFFSIENSTSFQATAFGDNQWIFIHENNQPINRHNSFWRSTTPGTVVLALTWTRDGANRIWSTSGVIASGQPTRTIQTIGISVNQSTSTGGGVTANIGRVWSATVLSSPVTQLNTQSLEITYRYAFSRE
jgi:hypothetical protein